ncbi:Membrane protein involved in the export of O-antigen and teichoic acid [Pseudobutyrivibrio sp. JW11]|uniref:flippase n=1 Tax=Pseudobutyrivibrio sp. JW11 TaxID=1855302 RepID=UPI0008ED6A63|nr:flippase [Pseudobutyrivibrio sp. JW11]SFO35095.1 Membrane protein involved in the export of O-antigen and teichoic acid [Pseudobutyrivibrio sp. JW11]
MKSLKRNYIYNLIYQIVLVIAPLVTTPYVSRVLGASNIGIYSYAESILTYYKMFAALGIGLYGQRELSYVRDEKTKRTHVFWEAKTLEFITSIIALLVYLCFSATQKEYSLYLVLVFGLLAGMFDIAWFFYGMEEVGKIVGRNLVFKVIGILYIFIFVKTKNDLLIYAFGNMFFMFISNLSLWIFLPKYISFPVWKEIKPLRNLKVSIALLLPTATTQLFAAIDKTMIGRFAKDSYENGYYEQAIKVERLALMVVTSVAVVLIPRIGYYFSNKNKEMLEKYMYKGYRFVWMISIPLCLGLIGITKNMVPWFFGDGYEPVGPLLYVLSFLIIFMGINCISGSQYLIPTKRENKCTVIVWSGSIINLSLNILLIPRLYAMGASLASLLAEIITMFIYFYVIKDELSISKILLSSVKYWFAGVVMLGAVLVASTKLVASALNTLILIILGMLVYGIILLLFRDEMVIESIDLVLNRFKIKYKNRKKDKG